MFDRDDAVPFSDDLETALADAWGPELGRLEEAELAAILGHACPCEDAPSRFGRVDAFAWALAITGPLAPAATAEQVQLARSVLDDVSLCGRRIAPVGPTVAELRSRLVVAPEAEPAGCPTDADEAFGMPGPSGRALRCDNCDRVIGGPSGDPDASIFCDECDAADPAEIRASILAASRGPAPVF